MNCQPGDIAICVVEGRFKGKIMDVLYAAPTDRFFLPDGYPAKVMRTGAAWVVKLIGGPLEAPLENGGTRTVFFGIAADSDIRPLRGMRDYEEVEQPVAVEGTHAQD